MLKKVALAVAAAFVAQAASASSIDFHGYMRAGIGGTDKGGNQQCFEENYPDQAKYRLGNECDNYAELAFDTKLYKGADGVWSNYHVRMSMRDVGAQNFQSSGSMGNGVAGESNPQYFQSGNAMMQWAQREDYVDFGGYADSGILKNSKIWLGNRFDNRNDVHINDYYYWDNSGEGVGIEGIELGPVKAALNIMQQGGSSGLDGAPRDYVFDSFNNPQATTGGYKYTLATGHRFQVRFYEIPVWKNGKLEVAYQYIKANSIDVYSSQSNNVSWTRWAVNAPSQTAPGNGHGSLFTVQWQQSSVLGGYNKLALQYGKGDGAGGNWVPAYATLDNGQGNITQRLVEQFEIAPTKSFNLFGDFIYQKDRNGSSSGGGTDTWVSAGVRPVYNFTNNFSLAVELSNDLAIQGAVQRLTKFTVAPQLAAGPGFWARPVFRVFYTHADWNSAAAGGVNAMTNGVWYGQKTGNTFGAQVEAWW